MEFKYVMFSVEPGARKVPVLFPAFMVHACVAEAIHTMEGMHGAVPVSAGSVSMHGSQLVCHDQSTSLNLKPHKDDAAIIGTHSYTHGYCFERKGDPK